VLDRSGNPHIAYLGTIWVDENQKVDLRYAHRDGSGWHTEIVDSAGMVGYHASLALDRSNHPLIVYTEIYHNPTSQLKYAYRDVTGWHFQNLYSFSLAGWGMQSGSNSLTLDASDRPHTIFCDTNTWGLTYLYQDAAGWHQESADDPWDSSSGQYPSLVLDAAGYPRASHYNYSKAFGN